MTTKLAIASPFPTAGAAPAAPRRPVPAAMKPGLRTAFRSSGWQAMEALVTVALMAWFAAALAGIIGEMHGAPSGPEPQPAATEVAPSHPPQAAARPRLGLHAGISLI